MKLNSLLPSHTYFARICCKAALLMLMLLSVMPSANAEDIDCNSTFPGPIQSYDPAGHLYMQFDAHVLGFSGVNVCFPRIHNEHEMALNACGSGKCVLNDNPYNRLSRERTDVQLRSSIDRNNRYTVAQWTEPYVVVGETPNYGRYVSAERFDIGSLTINGNGSGAMVSFSDNFSSYTLGNVRFDEDGVLRLTAGKTYIIDGNVTLSAGRILVVGSGKTNFYISGNYTSHNASQFLGDADIDIYVGGDFTLTSNSTVHGSVYVAGRATFENSSRLVGEIAARTVELKSASTVVYRRSQNIEGRIDHFEIDIDDTPLTCTPLNMTIKACSNADCSEVFNEPVSATLQPNDDHWVTGNPINFSAGSTTISLSKTQVGSVTLDVSGSAPVTKAFSDTLCRQNGGPLSTQACTVNFSDSGFILDVPDKLAAKSELVSIKAVKKDDFSQRCVSAFANTDKNLRFWSSVVERPNIDGYNAPPVVVNNHAIGESASSPNIQSVTFDERGEARVNVNYADAGKMALNVQYFGDSNGDDADLVMNGSDNFVSFPAGLCVTATAPASQCDSPDASCTAFTAAGAPFELNVRAKQWQSDNDSNICDNADTPSFAMTNVSLSHKLLAPSAGQLGELALQNYSQQASRTGTSVQQAISEVGVFTVAASVNQPYLGSTALAIPAFDSAPIGRFYPASFTVDGVNVPPACGAFTYLGQPFNVSMTLKALNTSATLTQNYTGTFASGQPVFEAKDGTTSTDLSKRLPALTGSWLNGQLSYSNHSVAVARSTNAQPEGPYSQLELGIRVDDSDNVPMFNATMRANSGTLDCGGSCTAAHLTTMDMRLGRAALANSYGPENQPVLMNGQSQFWNGNQWQLNSDDSCSVVTPAMQTQQTNPVLGYSFEPALNDRQQVIRTGAPAAVSNGQFGLSWLASGTYQGKVTAPVIVPDYLKWYWQFDRAAEVLQDPRASAYFGRYRGNDRIINWRERR